MSMPPGTQRFVKVAGAQSVNLGFQFTFDQAPQGYIMHGSIRPVFDVLSQATTATSYNLANVAGDLASVSWGLLRNGILVMQWYGYDIPYDIQASAGDKLSVFATTAVSNAAIPNYSAVYEGYLIPEGAADMVYPRIYAATPYTHSHFPVAYSKSVNGVANTMVTAQINPAASTLQGQQLLGVTISADMISNSTGGTSALISIQDSGASASSFLGTLFLNNSTASNAVNESINIPLYDYTMLGPNLNLVYQSFNPNLLSGTAYAAVIVDFEN